MDNRIVSAGCCGILSLGWGALVITGHTDAAPLVNFLQMAAYTSLGLAAHGFVTKGQSDAQTPLTPSSVVSDSVLGTNKSNGNDANVGGIGGG